MDTSKPPENPIVHEKSAPVQGKGSHLPIVKIVWFSCVFFLGLFTFYAWKLFITANALPQPWWLPVIFYGLGVITYVMAEFMTQKPQGQLPPEFTQMIAYSMFEAVGLYGLILAVLTQSFGQSLVFLLAALVGLVRHRP